MKCAGWDPRHPVLNQPPEKRVATNGDYEATFVLKRPQPIFAERFHLTDKADLDLRIILGPAIFGVGWGLVGFCPGPALTALGFGAPAALLFVAAMLAGMVLARWIANRPSLSGLATPADRLGV